jgi:RNA polymerase sigma-70 factor, ECF subfamily
MSPEDHFAQIVDEHYKSLYRFAISLTKNECDACDLTQQTFYVWASKGHQLREPDKIKAWLFTTMYRAFLMGRRQQWRIANEEFNEAVGALEAEPVKPSDWPEALSALAQLDEIFRAPIALFYLDDFSYAQIAETLQTPLGTVKSRIARGIAKLRTILLRTHFDSKADDDGASVSVQDWDLSITR